MYVITAMEQLISINLIIFQYCNADYIGSVTHEGTVALEVAQPNAVL